MTTRTARIRIVPLVVLALAASAPAAARAASPLDGNGLWVWYVSKSGGSPEAIAKKAKKNGLNTVLVKSGDGESYWDQFTPELVQTLHDAGREACAWQFVYGGEPRAEARVGAAAVDAGADCLVIDAESHYEGRYKAAKRYVDELRDRIGNDYPVALATFPYVDYHPSFPYSVFLGKHGAQYNAPQMYWKAIGTSVGKVYRHTYEVNEPYDRPIFPLGQTWQNPSRKALVRFRKYARRYGADGVSWWSWQDTNGREWRWVSKPLKNGSGKASAASAPVESVALHTGDRGDLVVRAQQLLRGHGEAVDIDGSFDYETATAVRSVQVDAGLGPTGTIDGATWEELNTRAPVDDFGVPDSASVPTLRFEIPMSPGQP
jgi:hypothetical protein